MQAVLWRLALPAADQEGEQAMFKDYLKTAMNEKGLTISAAVRLTGISRETIRSYLAGNLEPDDRQRRRIAERIGLPKNYFVMLQTADDIEKTGCNVPVATAARLLDIPEECVCLSLQEGIVPFGYAANDDYYISPVLFREYTGIDATGERG